MPPLKPAHAALALVAGLVALALLAPLFPGEGLTALDSDALLRAHVPAPPTLRLLAPEDGQGVGASIPVSGEAAGEKNVLDVQYRLDGASWSSLPRVVGGTRVVPFSADLPVPEGDHVLEVRAYDGEAFSLVARALVRAAPTHAPPTVRILAPLDGQGVATGPLTLHGTADSPVPTRVFVGVDGHETEATVTARGPGGTATWSATVDLSPGMRTLTARAGDGLSRSVRVAAAPDAPPTLRVLAPQEGASFGGAGDPACPAACILFAGAAPGATEILVSLDGTPAVPLSREAPGTYTRDLDGAWTFALPTSRLLSGEHAAAFSPVGPDGAPGAPQTVRFAIRGLPGVRILGDEAPRPTHAPLRFTLEGERLAGARWLLDGLEIATGPAADVRLPTPGPHALTALARDEQGRTATARLALHALNQIPAASLDVPERPLSGPVPLSVRAHDPDGRVASFRWDFGDGATETTPGNATTHTFPRAGVFRVNVTPVDDQGAAGPAASGLVTVLNVGPAPGFSWTPLSPTLLETVTFTDASADPEGALVALRWSFDDGATAEGRVVAHRFTTRGLHEVTLTAQDAEGATASLTRSLVVGNLAPAVALVHEPAAIQTGAEVLFRDRSVKADGALVAWAWDFGHGCPGTPCDPMRAREASGASVLHAFPAPGKYDVRLTVTDDLGAQATRVFEILVSDALPTVERVQLDPLLPKGMDVVRFTAVARDAEGTLSALEWRFGDGRNATGNDVLHHYERSGVYQASVRARDAAAQTTEFPFLVVVANAKPNATLDVPSGVVAGQPVLLWANATDADGRVVRYRFDPDGDGVPDCDGTTPRCLFTYPEPGAYAPSLAVADDEGASVLVDVPLEVRAPVGPQPTALVDAPLPGKAMQGRVVLSGTAGGPRPLEKVEVQLRRGNATLSASRDPWMLATGAAAWRLHLDTRAFADGAYDLVVRVTDANGAIGLAQVPVLVANGPRESLVGLTLLDVPTAPLRADHEVRGSAWHPLGLVTVRYRLDEGPWRDAPGDPLGFAIPLRLAELSPGMHVLRIDARRGLLDQQEEIVTFRVAGPPPTLVVDEIPTPLAYGLLTASGRIVGEGRVQWRLDHDVWRDLPEGPAWRLAYETGSLDGGTHTVWLRPVSQDGLDEGDPVSYRIRVIHPGGMSDEDRRLLEEARVPPGEIDLEQVAREQQATPLGLWPVLLALGLGAAFRLRRARL